MMKNTFPSAKKNQKETGTHLQLVSEFNSNLFGNNVHSSFKNASTPCPIFKCEENE